MSKALHNILYVEDEPDIQRVVKLALETMTGMRVIGCLSGADAIACGANNTIDLILLDVMMPYMDGPTTLSHLRKIPALAQTPVVFMTAKAYPDEIALLKSLGALDVINKPFDPMALATMLQTIWARAQVAAAPPLPACVAGGESCQASATLTPEEQFAARMVALTAQFYEELPTRFETLQRQWQALQESWSHEAVSALHGSTHNLAGIGATFGCDELTVRARALDRQLKMLLTGQRLPDSTSQLEIEGLFQQLDTEIRRILARRV